MKLKQLIIITGMCLTTFGVQAQKMITQEDIWQNRTFSPASTPRWKPLANGTDFAVQDNDSTILCYDFKSGKEKGILFSTTQLDSTKCPFLINRINNYELSRDGRFILLAFNPESIYRHSVKSDYVVYDLKNHTSKVLSSQGKQQLAKFSPDGSKVAFVRDNNLFYTDLINQKEIQITKDGKFNEIINGTTDWVYEEEFGLSNGFYWSPKGDKIGFYRFDESAVKEFAFTMWGNLYTSDYKYKYPKAGEANSIVTLHIYHLDNQSIEKVDVGDHPDQYIPRAFWLNNDDFGFFRLNRLQNFLEIIRYRNHQSLVVYEERNPAYVEVPDFFVIKNGQDMIFTSNRQDHTQICILSLDSKKVTQITSDTVDVLKIYLADEKKSTVYYQAISETPINQAVFSIRMNGTNKKLLSDAEGVSIASFPAENNYVVRYSSKANQAPSVDILTREGHFVRNFVNNDSLQEKAKAYGFTEKTFGVLTVSDSISLNYWMMKPKDVKAGKKHPLLMFLYGGPGSQQVLNQYYSNNDLWYQMLTQKGYIVVCVDARGTGGRGEAFKKCTYLHLGKYESEDQINAAKYFGTLDYIDAKRIAIWGWSYGGYMSSLCLMKGADVFKTAMAVAPVTDWKFYDNIYTERYMRTPKENPEGYAEYAPLNLVEELKGPYFLAHGTADDNVHFQQAIALISAMNESGKLYQLYIYPNKNHSILGGKTRIHLYKAMTDFLDKNL